MKKEKDFVT